jgi:hypothetical protein
MSLLSSVRETIRHSLLFPDQPAKLSLAECRQRVIDAVPFCEKERYNVQRDIAQIVWMLRQCDEPMAMSLAEELKQHDFGDYWQKWLTEATTSPKQFKPVIPKPVPSTQPART